MGTGLVIVQVLVIQLVRKWRELHMRSGEVSTNIVVSIRQAKSVVNACCRSVSSEALHRIERSDLIGVNVIIREIEPLTKSQQQLGPYRNDQHQPDQYVSLCS